MRRIGKLNSVHWRHLLGRKQIPVIPTLKKLVCNGQLEQLTATFSCHDPIFKKIFHHFSLIKAEKPTHYGSESRPPCFE